MITRGTTGETIVKDWRDMIGPTNVEEAKTEAPDRSLNILLKYRRAIKKRPNLDFVLFSGVFIGTALLQI